MWEMYSWLSLSRPRLPQITAYLEGKIWSLPKHENRTTGKKYCGKEEKWAISPLFHNIFNISLTSRVQLHIYLLNVVNRIIFSSILQIWYVEVWISRSISESPLEFEITRVDYTFRYIPSKVSVQTVHPRPSCSKLTMSLVNDLLKFTSSDMQICWNFLLKKCE